jgi:hypothetical protein
MSIRCSSQMIDGRSETHWEFSMQVAAASKRKQAELSRRLSDELNHQQDRTWRHTWAPVLHASSRGHCNMARLGTDRAQPRPSLRVRAVSSRCVSR